MYSNIGKKIMTLAIIIAILMMIGSVGCGIYLLIEDMTTVGALIMVLGPIVSWIMGFFLYGYGRLIDNSDYIAHKMGRRDGYGIPDVSGKLDWSTPDEEDGEEAIVPPSFIAQRVVTESKPAADSFCTVCGNPIENSNAFCSRCGNKVN